jgi:signal transduction histidine kinase
MRTSVPPPLNLAMPAPPAPMGQMEHVRRKIDQELTAERRRIARDLHDLVGCDLARVQQNLELCSAYTADDPARASDRLRAARCSFRAAVRRIREVTSVLRSSSSSESDLGGLARVLTACVDAHEHDASGPRLTVQIAGEELQLAPDLRYQVFLVLREAIRNAYCHAAARNIWAYAEITPLGLTATVRDDGKGFDLASAEDAQETIGIACMRERAALAGGKLRIFSRHGAGTLVELAIPSEPCR